MWAFSNNFILGTPGVDYWTPIAFLSHMIDFQIFNFDPMGHHLTNILLHSANGIFLFFILRRLSHRSIQSALVALLFSIHPFQVETVSWITQRKGLLCIFFGFWTLWAYLNYLESKNLKRGLWVLFLFQLCLMSKMSWLTLPFTLLLIDFWPLERIQLAPFNKQAWTIVFKEKIPLFILTVLNGLHSLHYLPNTKIMETFESIPLRDRLSNAPVASLEYLGKIFWPLHLSIVYTHPGNSISFLKSSLCFFTIVVISITSLYLMKRYPYFSFGWFWFLGNLTPHIGIVQTEALAMADRFAYMPLIGILIIMIWGGNDLLTFFIETLGKNQVTPSITLKKSHFLSGAIASLIIIFLTISSYSQAGYWKNVWSLFDHVFDVNPDDWVAHYQVGTYLAQDGKLEEAKQHLQETLRIKPDHFRAHNALGKIYLEEGYNNLAINEFTESLKVKPEFLSAHFNLATALMGQGRKNEAIEHLRTILQIQPSFELAKKTLNLLNEHSP
jgi:hypothetical protein